MNRIDLAGRLRGIAIRAHFLQGLFGWLCLTNVTQLVQLYLYEGKSLPPEGVALLLLEGMLRVAGLVCCGAQWCALSRRCLLADALQ